MNEAIENPGDESIISSKRVARVAPERAFREQTGGPEGLQEDAS